MNERIYGLADLLASVVFIHKNATIDETIHHICPMTMCTGLGQYAAERDDRAKEVLRFLELCCKCYDYSYEDIKAKGDEIYRPKEEIDAVYDRLIAIYPAYLTYKNPSSKIYAISDVHGFLDILNDTVSNIKLGINDDLIFLGDYIDVGPHSRQTLEYLYNLQQRFPYNVVVLKGNHEELFLQWIEEDIEIGFLQEDKDLNTIKTFLKDNQLEVIADYLKKGKSLFEINSLVKKYIKKNHPELIEWVKKMPLYWETGQQIFVHAGIDEEAKDYWNTTTADYVFTQKYPATTGEFYKDIVAGHIGTSNLAGDENFHDIYFDGESHYYIDSTVGVSKKLNVLEYDSETGKYTFR